MDDIGCRFIFIQSQIIYHFPDMSDTRRSVKYLEMLILS